MLLQALKRVFADSDGETLACGRSDVGILCGSCSFGRRVPSPRVLIEFGRREFLMAV